MNHRELSKKLAEHFGYKLIEEYQLDDTLTAEIDFEVKEIRFRDKINSGWKSLVCIHELGHHILDDIREKRNNELTAWMMGLYYFKELPKFQGDCLSLEDAFKLFMEGILIGRNWGKGKTKSFSDD